MNLLAKAGEQGMSSAYTTIEVQAEGPVTRITLNRPEKLNAFSAELVEETIAAVSEAETTGTRLIVFQGAGKGFSGGFDLGGLEDMSDGDLLLRFVRVEQLLQQVYHARAATLALVHGPCYGAAAELVAACEWRFIAPDTRFRMPGSRFGIVLGTRRLTRLIGADATRQLVLRDKPFGAEEALTTGYINAIADPDCWPEQVAEVLGKVTPLDADTYAELAERRREDTREADMAALVQSVTNGSVKAKIQDYLEEIAAHKAAKS